MSRIYSRASWGARHVDGVGTRPVGNLETYLHHSVTTHLPATATIGQERAQCRVVESIGQQRFGRGISYTFLIFPSGRIYWGASIHRISYHSGGGRDGKPRNTLGAGICLVGNTDTHAMTQQQEDALVWLLNHGVAQGWWTRAEITEAHRDFKSTACPGRHAYKRITTINSRARGTTTARPTVPEGHLDMHPDELNRHLSRHAENVHAALKNDITNLVPEMLRRQVNIQNTALHNMVRRELAAAVAGIDLDLDHEQIASNIGALLEEDVAAAVAESIAELPGRDADEVAAAVVSKIATRLQED